MTIELCLFDLDNTLLRTNDLGRFRGGDNVDVTSTAYTQELLQAAFGQNAPERHLDTPEQLAALRTKFPKMRFGVFTRSPRHYAKTLLRCGYPGFPWDVVIGYEDVRKTKPHPEGIWVAAREIGITSLDQIALVGDEKVDVVCAYRAGCWSLIDQSTWQPRLHEHWWALERVPDALFNGVEELAPLLATPHLRIPELEYLVSDEELIARQKRIDKINHFFPKMYGGGFIPIHVMGRLFGDYEDIRIRRSWHLLTEQIHSHKNAVTFPDAWVKAIQTFVNIEAVSSREVVVTVIPFKLGRQARLESLLEQTAETYTSSKVAFRPTNIEFLVDVLAFRSRAVSNHGYHLNAEERFANVGENLFVKRPKDIQNKHVIVIDDVVTSGATLLWAHRYLMKAGASKVSCLSLTKAIGAN